MSERRLTVDGRTIVTNGDTRCVPGELVRPARLRRVLHFTYRSRDRQALPTAALDNTARRMVEFLGASGIECATVLGIGGGVGEIQIERLERGARSAVNLELSSPYATKAARILREAGL